MSDPVFKDAFKQARQEDGVLIADYDGEKIPLILRYKDVRSAAKDWQTFSSDAPFRIPIPSEEDVRKVRQLPIEADPPVHTDFRNLVLPFFRRPMDVEYTAKIDALIAGHLELASQKDQIDIVRDLALPIQSYALTYLLGMPEVEAEEWISWGIHVFHDGADSSQKGSMLDQYILKQLKRGASDPSATDFFAALTRMEVDGRKVTEDEMMGMANLTFAGGRDTVINAFSVVLGYYCQHTSEFDSLADDPRQINLAVEEFVRVITPLSHIARVCPHQTKVESLDVGPDTRVSLCWASANYDETVFEEPEHVKLDRSPNPHVGFGSGIHNCLGAPQARAILRSLIRILSSGKYKISILSQVPKYEETPAYKRWLAYDSLTVQIRKA